MLKAVLNFLLLFVLLGTGLAGCRDGPEQVTFVQLVSDAKKYSGKTVTLEAYYFTGFEITALSGSVGPSTSGPWRIVPTGTLIWAKGGAPEDVYNRMYRQSQTPSGYEERVGLLKVTGRFETGGRYGHLDAYKHLITITDAELLEWSPPPAALSDDLPAETTRVEVNPGFDVAAARKAAEDFILNSATFKFDGIPGSLAFSHGDPSAISAFRSWQFTFKFETAHPGHGDRAGLVLAQVITAHYAEVLVNLENNRVMTAVCDGTWDMLKDKELGVNVSGIVVGGGDITPPGLMDAPRIFTYQVLRKEGLINVSYTAYPPSPAGDAARKKITLEFFGGLIRVGDKMEAYGTLDRGTNTVVVASEGDYIRTYEVKADVIGVVVGIKDARPGERVFELLRSDGTYVNVRYNMRGKAGASLYGAEVRVGYYLRAVGTYEKINNSVIVATEFDMIKAYDHNPIISGIVFE